MREREFSIRELLAVVLKCWRALITVAVLGGILFGVLGAAQYRKAMEEVVPPIETEAQLLEALSEAQRTSVETTLLNEEALQVRQEYVDRSLYMGIDPLQEWRAEINYCIRSESSSDIQLLAKLYDAQLCGTEMYQYLSDELRMDSDNLNDVVFYGARPTGTESDKDDLNGITFQIVVLSNGEEMCLEMVECVNEYISNLHASLSDRFAKHTAELQSDAIAMVTDTTLQERKKQYLTEITNYTNTIGNTKNAFTPEMWQYYWILRTREDPTVVPDEIPATEQTAVQYPYSYPVIGMVGGMLLVALIIVLRYLCDPKVKRSDNFTRLYGVEDLGHVASGRIAKGFDQAIERMSGGRNANREERLKQVASALQMWAQRNDIRDMAIIGSGMNEESRAICDALEESLDQIGIKTTILEDWIYHAERLSKLKGVKAAVMVETEGITLCREVVEERDFLRQQGILLYGAVVQER